MFDQPEFIQPLTEPPKQPDPIAGLGEFLQIHLGDNVKNLKAIDNVDELFEYLKENPNAILWLDLEIDRKHPTNPYCNFQT